MLKRKRNFMRSYTRNLWERNWRQNKVYDNGHASIYNEDWEIVEHVFGNLSRNKDEKEIMMMRRGF